MLGGVLLIVFGVIGLWSVATDRVYGHTHVQGHDHHAHFHLHVGHRAKHPLPSAHSHLPTFVGAAFAVSSLRALTMLAPFGHRVDTAPVATLLVLIVVFAVGILLSMSLFGVAFARLMSARVVQRLGRAAGAVDGCRVNRAGVYWVVGTDADGLWASGCGPDGLQAGGYRLVVRELSEAVAFNPE